MGFSTFTSDPDSPLRTIPAAQREFYPHIIEKNFGPPHCWLAPIDIVRRAGGFYEPLHWFEDWDLWWRVGLHAGALVPVDYPGALYRQHPQSQLATVTLANRTRGHAIITARMAQGILQRPDLLDTCGSTLLWAIWTALGRARQQGVSWGELEPLSASLLALVSNGPASVTSTKLARTTRLLGVKPALSMQQLASRFRSPHATR
jgi:hypothetical protein